MATTNNTTYETFETLLCSTTLTAGIDKQLTYLSVFNIFLSITAVLGNTLILAALHKESSLHPPSKLLLRCLATTDLCVGLFAEPLAVTYWMAIVRGDWNLCRFSASASYISGYTLGAVSSLTMAAISVDRLLALLMGLRYRQIVTLKRTYLTVAVFWVVSSVAAATFFVSHLTAFWYVNIVILLSVVTSFASYTKIFVILRRHHFHAQYNVQQRQPTEEILLDIGRYRKAVYTALQVQLALIVCYFPYGITTLIYRRPAVSFLVRVITVTFVYLNSSLNPFLYCWKISEVRQAVKETIRQALCCPWD